MGAGAYRRGARSHNEGGLGKERLQLLSFLAAQVCPKPPACRSGLQSFRGARLDVKALLAQIFQDSRAHYLPLERLEGPFQTVALPDSHFWHRPQMCPVVRQKARAAPMEIGTATIGLVRATQSSSFVTFSAAGPFSPSTRSNSTRSPSASDLKPSP